MLIAKVCSHQANTKAKAISLWKLVCKLSEKQNEYKISYLGSQKREPLKSNGAFTPVTRKKHRLRWSARQASFRAIYLTKHTSARDVRWRYAFLRSLLNPSESNVPFAFAFLRFERTLVRLRLLLGAVLTIVRMQALCTLAITMHLRSHGLSLPTQWIQGKVTNLKSTVLVPCIKLPGHVTK